jgi:hypothetical protein
MSFVIAGIIFVGTVAFAGLLLYAGMMSDNPQAARVGPDPVVVLGVGTLIAVAVASSHWWLPALQQYW